MQNHFQLRTFSLIAVVSLILAGCGGQDAKLAKEAEVLMANRDYNKAMSVIKGGLLKDPKSKPLLKQRILLFLKAEQPDYAYAAYLDFSEKVSKNDSILVDSLSNQDPTIRASAAKALSAAKDPKTLAPLTKLATDKEEQVRRAAVNAISQLKDPRAADTLTACLKDSSWFVRGEAARGLGMIGDAKALDSLFVALEDADDYVRSTASRALVELVAEQNKALFTGKLSTGSDLMKITAAMALAKLGDKSGVPILLSNMKGSNSPSLRRQCVEAIAKIKDPANLQALQGMLGDKDPSVRLTAIRSMASVPNASSLPLLKKIVDDKAEPDPLRGMAQQVTAYINRMLAAPKPATP